jgi:dynein heavy chain
VGATLRVRSRKFPALTNCTSIDWFHEWPEEALMSVSERFLSEGTELTVSGISMCFSKFFVRMKQFLMDKNNKEFIFLYE